MKTNQAPSTEEEYNPDDYNSPEERKKRRLGIIDNILQYHASQLAHGAPTPSQYIPYMSVYTEFKRQHKIAIERLRGLRKQIEEEENND